MLTGKLSAAFYITASVNFLPVIRLLDPDLTTMCRALERKIVADTAFLTTLYLGTASAISDRRRSMATMTYLHL